MVRTTHARTHVAAVVLLGLVHGAIGAQSVVEFSAQVLVPGDRHPIRGSRYLSLESPAYDAITVLRTRGLLSSLDPLARPYTRDEVARAVAAVTPAAIGSLPAHAARRLALIRAEVAPELARLAGSDSVIVGFSSIAGGSASTSHRFDALFPLRDHGTLASAADAWPYHAIGGWAEYGRFAAETRLFHDYYLERADPEVRYVRGIVVLNRTDNAYVTAAFDHGSVFAGRMRRDWAPLGDQSLAVSAVPQTYPQLGFELGGSRLVLRTFLGELDTIFTRDRYLLAQQLEYRARDFAISIGEAKVHVTRGGPTIASLNPLDLSFFSEKLEPGDVTSNLVVHGQLWLRRGPFTLTGQGLLDDVHVNEHAPLRAAISGGLRLSGDAVDAELDYRAVAAFTYWTLRDDGRDRVDQWSYYGRGLGDNFSDYDRLTLRASIHPRPAGLTLTPTIQLQRKGEGDFRMPSLYFDQFRTQRTIFLGTRETTLRAALAGRYDPAHFAFVEWDAGVNVVRNADHQPGRSLSEFAGTMRAGFSWTWPGVRQP